MSTQTGGPAFPVAGFADCPPHHRDFATGMTLRDYFAAAALTGLIQNIDNDRPPPNPDVMALAAYRMAEMMLVERAKP